MRQAKEAKRRPASVSGGHSSSQARRLKRAAQAKERSATRRRGDTLAVVRLDRLGRSLAEPLATVTMLKERGVALLSLEERIDAAPAAANWCSTCSAPSRASSGG